MKKKIFKLIEILDKTIAKNNTIIFTSFPDYSDNSYAVFRYMVLNNEINKEYNYIWLVSENAKKSKKRF